MAKLRASIERDVPAIVKALISAAKGGDIGAARLLLERTVPALKPIELPVPIRVPDGSLTAQGQAVLQAAAAGELSPSQLAAILAGLGALAKLVESDEHARRLAALERKNGIETPAEGTN